MGRPKLLALAGAVALCALVAGALLFKPWLLFVDVRVDDTLPVTTSTTAPQPTPSAPTTAVPPSPVELLSGSFTSHEHSTSGQVRVIRNPDGGLVVAIENLDTSNGPDVHVWLSAAEVIEGTDGWYTAGGAAHIDLGPLRGNLGDQLYDIPAGTDLSAYRGIDLWCEQFSVSFGAAALA